MVCFCFLALRFVDFGGLGSGSGWILFPKFLILFF